MTERQKVITAGTLIPLGAISVVVTIVWWASGVDAQVRASTTANERQDRVLLEHAKALERTVTVLERIERK